MIKEIEEKEASLKRLQKEPEGALKILAPKSFTTLALGDAIASFAAAYPQLNISLMLDDLSFRSYDFIERGFDVAVHTTPIGDSNLVTRKIHRSAGSYAPRQNISSTMASREFPETYPNISAWFTSIQTQAIASGGCTVARVSFQ